MKRLMVLLLTVVTLAGIIPVSYAAENVYTVENVYFSDLSGKKLEHPSTSCVVNVELKKHTERFGADTVVIASYSTDGAMIGFTTLAGSIAKDDIGTFSTLVVSPTEKNIGVVKTYVWNNISEMKPLSDVKEVLVNKMDDGVVLPSLEEQPIREKYIPDTVTVVGTITNTYKSDSSLRKTVYMVNGLCMKPVFDDLYTPEEYYAYTDRIEQISNYYEVYSGLNTYKYGNVVTFINSDFDLSDYLAQKCRFTFKKNNYGDLEVVNFEPLDEGDDVKLLDAKDYVQFDSSTNKIRFGSKNYRLGSNYELYINGCGYYLSDTALFDSFLSGAQGKIKLVRDTGYYSKIFVDYYETAKVVSVEYEDGVTTVVTTAPGNAIAPITEIIVADESVEDGDTCITVNKNGKTIELKDLESGDIIACAADFGSRYSTIEPWFIEIEASDQTVSGTVTKTDDKEQKIYIGETAYSCVDFDAVSDQVSLGSTYKLTLDVFGRIYDCEKVE